MRNIFQWNQYLSAYREIHKSEGGKGTKSSSRNEFHRNLKNDTSAAFINILKGKLLPLPRFHHLRIQDKSSSNVNSATTETRKTILILLLSTSSSTTSLLTPQPRCHDFQSSGKWLSEIGSATTKNLWNDIYIAFIITLKLEPSSLQVHTTILKLEANGYHKLELATF